MVSIETPKTFGATIPYRAMPSRLNFEPRRSSHTRASATFSSTEELTLHLRQAARDLLRILVVDLLQHAVRQVDSIQLPERVIVPVIVEVLVARLEHSPVIRIFLRLERILSEQDAVLILHEEVVCRMWLASNVVQHCANLGVHV